MEYLDEEYSEVSLTPTNAKDRAKMRAWFRFFEEVPTVAVRFPSYNAALPPSPVLGPVLDASQEALDQFRIQTMRLVCAASILGLPQITVPIGTVDGGPVGISFIG